MPTSNFKEDPKYCAQRFVPLSENGKVLVSCRIELDCENDAIYIHSDHPFRKHLSSFKLYKYLPYSSLKKCLDKPGKEYLFFNDPTTWCDPYERKVPLALNRHKKGAPNNISCFCATYAMAYNEEPMWASYNSSNRNNNSVEDKTIRIEIDFSKLLDKLDEIAKNEKVTFFVSLIDYSLDSKEISQICNNTIKTEIYSILRHVQLLGLKRKAFAYENEIRIFAVHEDSASTFNLPIDFGTLVTQVMLPPVKPHNTKPITTKQLRSHINKKLIDALVHELKINPKIIKQSRLYSLS